jgi:hypothetical protein
MLTLKTANYKVEDLSQLSRCLDKSLEWLYEVNRCTNMGAHCPTCASKTVCGDLNRLRTYIESRLYADEDAVNKAARYVTTII